MIGKLKLETTRELKIKSKQSKTKNNFSQLRRTNHSRMITEPKEEKTHSPIGNIDRDQKPFIEWKRKCFTSFVYHIVDRIQILII